MNSNMVNRASVLATWLILSFCAVNVWSQSSFLGPNTPTGLVIEWNKPSFDGDTFTFLTSSIFLTEQFALSDGLRGVVEIPVAHTGIEGDFDTGIEGTSLGNPYVGISSQTETSTSWFEFGLRVPLTTGEAWSVAALSNLDRLGAFGEDIFSFGAAANTTFGSNPVKLHFRIHPNVLMPTGDNRADSELFVDYSGFAWVQQEKVDLGIGFQGWALLTESEGSFGDRSIHELGIAARVKLSAVEVGLRASIPLDEDLKEILNNMIGLNVTIPISAR